MTSPRATHNQKVEGAIRSPSTNFATRRSAILAALEPEGFALPSCCELDRYAASDRPVAEIVAEWKADPRCIVRTETYRMLERRARETTAYMINPAFSLWLMGFPAEWESCAPQATRLSRRSRQSSSLRSLD